MNKPTAMHIGDSRYCGDQYEGSDTYWDAEKGKYVRTTVKGHMDAEGSYVIDSETVEELDGKPMPPFGQAERREN